jgi:hypothetical protein
MAPAFTPDWDSLSMHTYTLSEACDLMRILNLNPTTHQIKWKNAKTGAPVYIGYNDAPKRKYEMVKSKSNFIPQTNNSPKQKSFLK